MGWKNYAKRTLAPIWRHYENFIIDRFHRLYYHGRLGEGKIFRRTDWMQIPCLKCPLDLWVYQEIINEVQPDLIIETGTNEGGSALFLAHVLDLIGKGRVVTIDILDRPRRQHPRIQYVTGSSTDEILVRSVIERLPHECCMVILDSDHSKDHVAKELRFLSRFVTVGNYLIVEDTNLNGHPAVPQFGPGPYEAVSEFLACTDNFVMDDSREKFLMTFNPKGFLKRVK
jgi:cephalosporin hydroxylase